MRGAARQIMQQYMHDIYAMTTINHEHLCASFLRVYPYRRIRESDYKRSIFYAATQLGDGKEFFLHRSLQGCQAYLLTDDRRQILKNFLQLAIDKGVIKRDGDYLFPDCTKLSQLPNYHRGRIENPIEIMANEVEPLVSLQKILRSLGRLPRFWVRFSLARYLFKEGTCRLRTVMCQL